MTMGPARLSLLNVRMASTQQSNHYCLSHGLEVTFHLQIMLIEWEYVCVTNTLGFRFATA